MYILGLNLTVICSHIILQQGMHFYGYCWHPQQVSYLLSTGIDFGGTGEETLLWKILLPRAYLSSITEAWFSSITFQVLATVQRTAAPTPECQPAP